MIRQAEGTCHRDRNEVGIGDRGQIDVPHTVVEFGSHVARDVDGQTGLAGAAGGGQGDQPVVGERLPHVVDLCAAADEAGELHGEMFSGDGFRCPKGREVVADVRVAQLRHAFWTGDTAQLVPAEIGQPRIGRQRIGDQILRRSRKHAFARRGRDRVSGLSG